MLYVYAVIILLALLSNIGNNEASSSLQPQRENGDGCCVILSIAHSLVRKNGGVVKAEDVTVLRGQYWDPCFLQQIWVASGSQRSTRSLYPAEARKAQRAHWNDAWKLASVGGIKVLYDNKSDHQYDVGRKLKRKCEKLKRRVETKDYAVLLTIGSHLSGHMAPVESVMLTEDAYHTSCSISVWQTSIQGPPGNKDFRFIPFNIGTVHYKISTFHDTGETRASTNDLIDYDITNMMYDTFAKDKRYSSLPSTWYLHSRSNITGERGTAFNAQCPETQGMKMEPHS